MSRQSSDVSGHTASMLQVLGCHCQIRIVTWGGASRASHCCISRRVFWGPARGAMASFLMSVSITCDTRPLFAAGCLHLVTDFIVTLSELWVLIKVQERSAGPLAVPKAYAKVVGVVDALLMITSWTSMRPVRLAIHPTCHAADCPCSGGISPGGDQRRHPARQLPAAVAVHPAGSDGADPHHRHQNLAPFPAPSAARPGQ